MTGDAAQRAAMPSPALGSAPQSLIASHHVDLHHQPLWARAAAREGQARGGERDPGPGTHPAHPHSPGSARCRPWERAGASAHAGLTLLPAPCSCSQDLLLWTNPRNSAIALGVVTAAYAALRFGAANPLLTGAYIGLVLVLGCFLWNNIASFTHRRVADRVLGAWVPPQRDEVARRAPVIGQGSPPLLLPRARCTRRTSALGPFHRQSAMQATRACAAAAQGGCVGGAGQGLCSQGDGAHQQGAV